ncbi:MAG: 2-amino-4,5-dihydroxy-6-one-heptanoic acid-7-phosphate synthase [Pseudonocardiaceae bacterium]|nr:2-amino-4,5-dihydroxy-6-one-heptanoic acid-7-phosphate synthase [Pseudonocardiaceae bacterium]
MELTTNIVGGKRMRITRLGREKDSGTFIVPMDHSVTVGPIADGDGLNRMLDVISRNGADGVVLHAGRARFAEPELFRHLALIVHLSASTAQAPDTDEKVLVAQVELALELGADAVSVHVNLGSDTESAQLADLGRVAARCTRWGVPLLAMVYPRGPRIADPSDPELVAHAANVAADLGADMVKTPYTGSTETMTAVVDTCPIPVFTAGGSRVDGESQLYGSIRQVMRAGAAGVAVGRNVFQAKDVGRVTREISDIVHDASSLKQNIA